MSFTCLLESEDSPSSSKGFTGTLLTCPCASFFCLKREGKGMSSDGPGHLVLPAGLALGGLSLFRWN